MFSTAPLRFSIFHLSIIVNRMDNDDATAAAVAENANSLKRKSDDMGWSYGELVDPNNTMRAKCNFLPY
jgi:hypothetical protein